MRLRTVFIVGMDERKQKWRAQRMMGMKKKGRRSRILYGFGGNSADSSGGTIIFTPLSD